MQHAIAHLGPADAKQMPVVAAAIAARFQHLDPTAWLIDDPHQRVGIMLRNITMWAEHALTHGEIHIATNYIGADGSTRTASIPQAAALWFHYDQPGGPSVPDPAGYRERLAQDCGKYAENFAALDELFAKHHPLDRGPHHYLAFLAALHAGNGQGTALLRHHLAFLDGRELGAYLVAADGRSRDLYARHGFEVLDPLLELPGTNGPAHVMYPMWRSPHPPGAR